MKEYSYESLTPDELESLTPEELDALIQGEVMQAVGERKQAQKAAQMGPQRQKATEGMSGTEQFLAGAGREMMRIPRGLREIGIGMFGTPSEIAAYNQEKRAQTAIDKDLMETWPAKAGQLGVNVLTAAALPARLGAQMGAATVGSALSPTKGDISGPEWGTRAAQGGEAGLVTGAIGYPMGLIGKGLGGATKRYTDKGVEAMRLSDAAKRLGVSRNVGSLDPSSPLNTLERNLPGYAASVGAQADDLTKAMTVTKDIPSKTGRSFEPRVLEGEKLRAGIQEAKENLEGVGRSLWNDLDDYVVQNNLAPVAARESQAKVTDIIQKYTPIGRRGMQLDKNPIFQRVAEYDPDSAQLLRQFVADPRNPPKVPFSDLHKLSSAVGKALGRAEKDAGAPGASLSDRQVRTELKSLYGTLMRDVDDWGAKNPQAKDLFNEARTFWRERVVPGAQTNKVATKASRGVYGSNVRGYQEPRELYSDVLKSERAMQDLYPYMGQETRDILDTLTTMPDVAQSLVNRVHHPAAGGPNAVNVIAGTAVGSPLLMARGITAYLPGMQGLSASEAAKRFYFGRDVFRDSPLGKASWGALQYPQQRLEEGVRDLRTREKP